MTPLSRLGRFSITLLALAIALIPSAVRSEDPCFIGVSKPGGIPIK